MFVAVKGFSMEHEFLAAIHDVRWNSAEEAAKLFPNLFASLVPKYQSRLFVYRNAHFARVTSNLATSVYHPASHILGNPFVEQVLQCYFEAYRATNPCLSEAALGLSDFVKSLDFCADFPFTSDVFDYCEQRWKLLCSKDPVSFDLNLNLRSEKDLMSSRLAVPCAFLASAFPLFDLLESAETAQSRQGFQCDLSVSQSILMFRPSVFDFTKVSVSSMLAPFVKGLVDGRTLAEALEVIETSLNDEVNISTQTTQELSALMCLLTEAGVLAVLNQSFDASINA
jgi:hypothetical protein